MNKLLDKIKWLILSPLVRLRPEDGIYRTDYDGATWYIPYPKRWMALWARDFMKTHIRFENVIKRGDIVVEVGACTGEYTVPISQLLGPSGHIYAFEADPLSYKCLCKNIETSTARSSITIENAGVSNRNGKTLVLQHLPNSIASSSFQKQNVERPGFSIETVTLDSYFAHHPDERRVSLLKLTVNGHEPEIISGASKLLQYLEYVTFQSVRHVEAINLLKEQNFQVISEKNLRANIKSVLLRKIQKEKYYHSS